MKPVRLADLTARQFAAAATANPVILLPLGSHEDHGPHLPMGDFVVAELLAAKIATACAAPVFVAPTLPYGAADYFASSPGAMALSPAGFRAVLHDLLGGLIAQGLTRIVILNGHGGNAPIIHEVTLGIKNAQNIVIPSFYLWKIARALMAQALPAGSSARFGHGAEPLASVSLALRPALTDFTALPAQPLHTELGLPVCGFGTVDFEGLPVDVPSQFHQVPDDPVRAAAPLASAALGTQVADALVAKAAAFITHFAAFTG
ncbi:MAG: hypothetical protein B7Z75_01360 [Acidocella sp. 20-57-95]|nr:MAG: hypothetical protein B7Z75_01360 [Acidocella sp. 20-57-95]